MKWRFINTGINDGAYNMAVDEVIMQFVAEGLVPPTLRFYGWNPPAISLGYFQHAAKEVDLANCRDRGIDVVRRLTGGRAVLHDKELTYSIILPDQYPGIPKTVTDSYRLLSQGLLEGFKELGIAAQLAPQVKLKSTEFTSGACFDAPSSYELTVDGKKIVGSAQVRRQGVILQHGSILNELDIDKLFDCLVFTGDEVRERTKRIFSQKATSISDINGKPAEWEELCSAFYQGFSRGLDIAIEVGELTPSEVNLINQLVDKYRSDEWNLKK